MEIKKEEYTLKTIDSYGVRNQSEEIIFDEMEDYFVYDVCPSNNLYGMEGEQ